MPTSTAQRVAEAKQRVENLSVDQVAAELERGALLVDLRETEERQEHGTIPGALHVPRGLLDFHADPASSYHRPELQPDRRIILHCAAGGRSALGADLLRELGYSNVGHLDGGYTAWKAAGKPTDSGK